MHAVYVVCCVLCVVCVVCVVCCAGICSACCVLLAVCCVLLYILCVLCAALAVCCACCVLRLSIYILCAIRHYIYCALRLYIYCVLRHYMPCCYILRLYIYCAARKQIVASARKSGRKFTRLYRKSRLRNLIRQKLCSCVKKLPPTRQKAAETLQRCKEKVVSAPKNDQNFTAA